MNNSSDCCTKIRLGELSDAEALISNHRGSTPLGKGSGSHLIEFNTLLAFFVNYPLEISVCFSCVGVIYFLHASLVIHSSHFLVFFFSLSVNSEYIKNFIYTKTICVCLFVSNSCGLYVCLKTVLLFTD